MLNRYNNIEYINNLCWLDGVELINKAFEKRNEQREWDMWISVYPNMDKKTFVSFEKFRSKQQPPKQNTKVKKKMTKDEILEHAEELRKVHQGIHDGVKKVGD